GSDIYQHAARLMAEWTAQGVLAADSEESLWALEQDFQGPDGARHTRRGFLCRVRAEGYGPGGVRPHERTQPGPKEDRLRLTRATRHSMSPIFALHEGNAWPILAPSTEGAPWATVTDPDGTVNRVWRITDHDALAAVAAELEPSELLIADGHHRYETATTYADEIGGDGEHRYTLMALVSLDDPGLTVFGYHRLLTNLGDRGTPELLTNALREHFDVQEVPLELLDPAGEEGIGVFGYVDAHFKRGFRLRLKRTDAIDAALPDRSEAYRRLDAAILEELIFRGALGMTAEDVEAKRGIAYTAQAGAVLTRLDDDVHAAFLMRPTPIEQVRAVAAAGETMPPKSTYFFPKLLTGLVFNPLA
ncbi:MAG: DUF1015 domain-containing protein, partial [Actinomycetota bacterium]|nr:DUF1015 domain-containing protein [Actinomycetota bacterium]